MTHSVRVALIPPASAAVLSWLAPISGVLTGMRADVHPGGDPAVAVVHLVALVTWLLVGWLLVATATTLLGRVPGVAGRVGDAVSRHVSPALVRRAIGGSAALGIAVSPALAPAAALAAGCSPARLPPLDRAATACAPPASPTPLPSATTQPGPTGTPTAPATTATAPTVAHTRTVVAGDTLWGLAAAELAAAGRPTTPARIADRWPAWWQANRAVIGDDPDLIHVGTLLAVPDALEKTP